MTEMKKFLSALALCMLVIILASVVFLWKGEMILEHMDTWFLKQSMKDRGWVSGISNVPGIDRRLARLETTGNVYYCITQYRGMKRWLIFGQSSPGKIMSFIEQEASGYTDSPNVHLDGVVHKIEYWVPADLDIPKYFGPDDIDAGGIIRNGAYTPFRILYKRTEGSFVITCTKCYEPTPL